MKIYPADDLLNRRPVPARNDASRGGPRTAKQEDAKSGRLPDFLIVGAAKSGTTTLYAYLARHSSVFMSTPKEPEFFSNDDVYARGLAWYRSLFDSAEERQLVGEASTTYTRWPHTADAAARIGDRLPDAKLIYIVRHPVDRAYSHYAHHMRLGVTTTFEEALRRDSIYVDCSMYMAQIDRYRSYFDDSKILVLLLDDLKLQREKTLEAVQGFLGLSSEAVGAAPLIANQTGAHHLIRSRTTGRLRRLPGANRALDALPEAWRRAGARMVERSPIGRRIGKEFDLPPMQDATREDLLERFADPTAALASYLDRDLSSWTR